MCIDCVKQKCPDRGSFCVDDGSYTMNFHECAECHKKEPIKIEDRQKETDDDGAETISYSHRCSFCNHCIAEHSHIFQIDGEFQEYSMLCVLCGRGEDTVSILPTDPREVTSLY
ncbi:churchill-like protein [Apostichopus japonicus]|uniref:Protein Churchill n=1 Tax=Stichopus japonicus TaxID=307972 RepID=A0A2G8LJ00_STIJA|nr:churchill-like protein [Apostichopus japonicus]